MTCDTSGELDQSDFFCCVHKLVLVNIGDHHTRVKVNSDNADQPPPAVLGCLLGAQSGREVDISNSFEIMYSMDGGAIAVDWAFLQERLEQCMLKFQASSVFCIGRCSEVLS